MTLTEQWKKGELPDGMYYMENTSGIIGMVGHSKVFPCYNVKQILAPVPSYEEWQASEKYNKHLEEVIKTYERKDKQATETSIAYNELAKENEELKEILERHKKATAKAQIRSCDFEIINTQLKELLEECRHIIGIEKDFATCHFEEYTLVELLTKIDEVLK